ELLAQREQVARHLSWLDTKIIHLRADSASDPVQHAPQPVFQAQPAPQPQQQPVYQAQAPAAQPEVAAVEQQAELLLRAPSSGVSSGFKVGCILTAIVTLLLSIGSFIAVSY